MKRPHHPDCLRQDQDHGECTREVTTPDDGFGHYRRLTITADHYAMNRDILLEDLARARQRVAEFEQLVKLNETVKPIDCIHMRGSIGSCPRCEGT